MLVLLCSLIMTSCSLDFGDIGGLINPSTNHSTSSTSGNNTNTNGNNNNVKQDGTSKNPYLISSVNDFKSISSKKGKNLYFKLANDIDFKSQEANLTFDYEKPFSHHLDGNGFSLINIKESGDLKETYSDGTALFTIADGATFTNIKIVDGNLSGTKWVGSLVGQANNCTFTNCSFSGEIKAITEGAGGIVGRATGCTFTNCSTTGEITVYSKGGGILGCGTEVNMSYCNSSMNLTSDSFDLSGLQCGYMGGLIGSLDDDHSIGQVIKECYATGEINQAVKCLGGGYVGGLIGYMTSYTAVENCYATGNVTNVGIWSTAFDKVTYYGGLWKNYRNPAGALIGGIHYLYDVNVKNCFAIGTVINDKACVQEDGFGLYCKTSLVGLVYDNFSCKHIKEEYKCPSFDNYRSGMEKYHIDITIDMLEDCQVHFENNYCVSDLKNTYTPCNYIVTNYLVYKSMPTYTITNNISKEELTIQETFAGFDFTNTWEMGEKFPELKNNK